jgi:hypothetical protein
MPARLLGGGRISSTEPSTIQIPFFGGRIRVMDAMFLTILDMQNLSVPSPSPEMKISDTVEIPETTGSPTSQGGVLCGAITATSLDTIPVSSQIADVCCSKEGEKYQACSSETVTESCDSLVDVLTGGCGVFPNLGSGICGEPETEFRQWIVPPVNMDVDSDSDGENDSFSAVFAFEATRVGVSDVTLSGSD